MQAGPQQGKHQKNCCFPLSHPRPSCAPVSSPLPHATLANVTECKNQEMDTARIPLVAEETAPTKLFWAILGMPATIIRQHLELLELKDNLREITQSLLHTAMAAMLPPALAPAAAHLHAQSLVHQSLCLKRRKRLRLSSRAWFSSGWFSTTMQGGEWLFELL